MNRLWELSILIIVTMLAGCHAASVIPAPSSPTPPPIPTDMPVEFPTPASSQTADSNSTSETPVPDPTPFVPVAVRLTDPGCCVQPFWSPDGEMVLFIDQPQPTAQLAIYGVSIEGGEVELVSEQIGLPSPDGQYLAFLNKEGETIVQQNGGGETWVIPDGGQRVFFSPGSLHLAWIEVERTGDFDQRKGVVSVSDIDGNSPTEHTTIFGGGIAGWIDDEHLLLVGREQRRAQDMALFSYSITDGSRRDLIRNQNIHSVRIAPGGEWVLYTITLRPDEADQNSLWVINIDGSSRYKLDVAGSARWRDESRLLVIPEEPEAASHRIWQFDANTGEVVPITDPQRLAFRVLAGDWSVSPTGSYVVFVNAEDQALWLLSLPPLAAQPPDNSEE